MKTCSKCGQTKLPDDFVKNRRGWCCACHHTYVQVLGTLPDSQAKLSKKRELVRSFKTKPCVVCEKSFHPCQMDFDHVRGVKRGEVSQLTSLSWEEILEEVGKCDVVCANCHRIRTNSRPQGNRRLSSEGVVLHA